MALTSDAGIVQFPPRSPVLINPVDSTMASNIKIPAVATGALNNFLFSVPNVAANLVGTQQNVIPASPVFVSGAQRQAVSQFPSSNIVAISPVVTAPVGAQQVPFIVSAQQVSPSVDVKGSIRTTGDSAVLSICARSCHPMKVANDHPCSCVRNVTGRLFYFCFIASYIMQLD